MDRCAWILVFSCWASLLSGATWYLSPEGNDNGSGSAADPWQTLNRAATATSAGDVVILADGTYRLGGTRIVDNGTLSNPVTYRAAAGASPRISTAEELSSWTRIDRVTWTAPWSYDSNHLFMEDRPLTKVTNESDLMPGTFWYDATNGRLLTILPDRSDPNLHRLEASRYVLDINTMRESFFAFEGLTFLHSDDFWASIAGIYFISGKTQWQVADLKFINHRNRAVTWPGDPLPTGISVPYLTRESGPYSLDDLKGVRIPAGTVITVEGYFEPGDGGEGTFVYNPTGDRSLDDEGGFYLRALDNGIWERETAGITEYLPQIWGAKGDGTTSAEAGFNRMLDALGSAPVRVTIDAPFALPNGLTFPDNVTLVFDGGRLISGAGTLTIHGPVEAEAELIFETTVPLLGTLPNPEVYPEWVQSSADTAVDAVRRIIHSFNEPKVVRLTQPEYEITTHRIWVRSGVTIRGQGMDQTTIRLADNAAYATNAPWPYERYLISKTNIPNTTEAVVGVTIADLTLDCNFHNQTRNSIDGSTPRTTVGGIHLTGYGNRIQNVRLRNQGPGSDTDVNVPNYGIVLEYPNESATVSSYAGNTLQLSTNGFLWEPGDAVVFETDDVLPSPLQPGTRYYIRSNNGSGVTVSTTAGGGALALSGSYAGGARMHYWIGNVTPNWIENCVAEIDADALDAVLPWAAKLTDPAMRLVVPFALRGWADPRDPEDTSVMPVLGGVTGCTIRGYPGANDIVSNWTIGVLTENGFFGTFQDNVMEGSPRGYLYRLFPYEFFVSTTGNDAHTGSLAAPWRDLSTALKRLRPGDILNVRGGVYETVDLELSGPDSMVAPITVRGHANEEVTISGGQVVTGWNASGNAWWASWAAGSNYLFEGETMLEKVVAPGDEPADYYALLRPGNSAADLVPGSFWIDQANGRIYVRTTDGTSPHGKTMTASVGTLDFLPWRLRNLRVENLHFAHSNENEKPLWDLLAGSSGTDWSYDGLTWRYGGNETLTLDEGNVLGGVRIEKLDMNAADNRHLTAISEARYADGLTVTADGYYDGADGGGGTYVFERTTDLTEADMGLVFPAYGEGIWRRQWDPGDPLDPLWYGAIGNGLADDWDVWLQLLRGASSHAATIAVKRPYRIPGYLEIPANVTLQFTGDGLLRVPESFLVINGPVEAPADQQIFDLANKVQGTSPVTTVYPEWFGLDTSDAGLAINRAIHAFADAKIVPLPAGLLELASRDIEVRSGLHLQGQGIGQTVIRVADQASFVAASQGKTPAISFGPFGFGYQSVIIEHLTVDCNFQNQTKTDPSGLYPNATLNGIDFWATNSEVRDVEVLNQGVGSKGGESFAIILSMPRKNIPVTSIADNAIYTASSAVWQAGERVRVHPGENGSLPSELTEGQHYYVQSYDWETDGLYLAASVDGPILNLNDRTAANFMLLADPVDERPNRITRCQAEIRLADGEVYHTYHNPAIPRTPELTVFAVSGWADDSDVFNTAHYRPAGEISHCTIRNYPFHSTRTTNLVNGTTTGIGRDGVVAHNLIENCPNGNLFFRVSWSGDGVDIHNNTARQSRALFYLIQSNDQDWQSRLLDVTVRENRFEGPTGFAGVGIEIASDCADPDLYTDGILIENNEFVMTHDTQMIRLYEPTYPRVRNVRFRNNTVINPELGRHVVAHNAVYQRIVTEVSGTVDGSGSPVSVVRVNP